jgi:3-oxoacyl-[acyl-carrier protein] reductase
VTDRLAGKVAIITGASTGLGPVMAARFVNEGAKVLLSARREDLVQEAAVTAGPGAIAMRADVTNENDVIAMVARAVEEFGHVDVLCNNAAAPGTDRYIWEQTLENWNATIAIDVTAAMLCTREVLKQSMLERRAGVILNFSST